VATTAPKPVVTTAAPRRAYTKDEIRAIIRSVWPDDLEDRAIAIATRETNLNPYAFNWCCYGLFAIYFNAGKRLLNGMGITSPEQLFDPVTNARAGYAIYQAAGWDPWKL
jgi:soluble lytic murein transglycosylase-like protein